MYAKQLYPNAGVQRCEGDCVLPHMKSATEAGLQEGCSDLIELWRAGG